MSEQEYLRKFTRELPVDLNNAELQEYGRMLADKVKAEKVSDDARKEENTRRMVDIKKIRAEIARLANARASGKELRGVMCAERINGNVVEVIRLDLNVVVDSRPASLTDLQTNMPFSEPDAPTVDEGRDNVIPFTGANVESSTGDTVHVGDPDDRDEEVEEEFAEVWNDDGASDAGAESVHSEAAQSEPSDQGGEDGAGEVGTGDDEDPEPNREASVTEGISDEETADVEAQLDDFLADREAWKQEEAERTTAGKPAANKAPPAKPTRERSAKVNKAKATANKAKKRK